ncbi:MAG: protein kinase, partial [archaeon]|nr:protein kinase [archaeon]
ELVSGGDLFHRIRAKQRDGRPYGEEETRKVVRGLLEGLSYAHSNGVVHRDLKIENIMLVSPSDDTCLKIIDWGMAKILQEADDFLTKSIVGTYDNVAPEVIEPPLGETLSVDWPAWPHWEEASQGYGLKVDIWAVGLIAYELLVGVHPIPWESAAYKHIVAGNIDFAKLEPFSQHCQEFVKALLVTEPENRPDANAALSLSWLSTPAHLDNSPIPSSSSSFSPSSPSTTRTSCSSSPSPVLLTRGELEHVGVRVFTHPHPLHQEDDSELGPDALRYPTGCGGRLSPQGCESKGWLSTKTRFRCMDVCQYDECEECVAAHSLDYMVHRVYSLEELKNKPSECDRRRLELYMDDTEFISVLGIDKAAWLLEPRWKKDLKKQNVGIF